MVNLSEIDTLLQTVMFTLYGNQYESREEHLLLTMFQASLVDLRFPICRQFADDVLFNLDSRYWLRNSRWPPSLGHCCGPIRLYHG